MSSYYRKQLEGWLAGLDVKAQVVLDVGGSQLPVKDRVRSWEVADYKIFDLKTPHKGEAPDVAGDLNVPLPMAGRTPIADTVFCLEVMEYIWNPAIALRNLWLMMKPEGTLYITFPFVYPQHEPTDQDFLRYTRAGAEKLLYMEGFEIEDVWCRVAEHPDALKGFYANDGMRAAKSGADHAEIGYIIKAIKK